MNTSIIHKIAFLMLIPVIGALVTIGMFYSHLAHMASDGAVINAAGRQRLLSKQLFIYATLVNDGQEGDRAILDKNRVDFEQALRVLEEGGEFMGYQLPPITPEVLAELARLRETWVGYQEAVLQLNVLPAGNPQALAAFEYIDANTQQLTDDANRLVTALQLHNKQKRGRMLYTLKAIAGFDMLLLAFGIWFIRRYIAERKRTEQTLRESEMHNRAVVDGAADGIVSIDDKGIIESFSLAAERMFDYAAGDVVGQNINVLIPEPDHHRHDEYLRRYRETGEAHFIGLCPREVLARRRDGSTFAAELAVNEMRLDDQSCRYVGILRDITQRKEAEAALLESQERNRAIVETAVDGIITIDESGFIDTFNLAAEKIFGYGAAEVVGRNITALMPEAFHQGHTQGMTRYLSTGETRILDTGVVEVVGMRKDATEFPMELALSAVHVDGHRYFTGILRDITKRKQAEEALRLSEERFTLVTRGTQDGLWDWNLQTGKIYFSPRWKAMLGYNEAEIANDFAGLQALIHPDDLGKALVAWIDCLDGATDAFSVEYRLWDKQGNYRWIQCRGLSVRDDDGEPVRMAGSHTDIGERRQAQEELQKASTRLHYLVDNSPAVIYSAVASGDFRITSVSENVTRLLGYTPAEMLADQNFWHDHIHPDDLNLMFTTLFTLFSDMEQTHDYRFRHKDGHYCWIHDTLRVVCNTEGDPVEVLGSLLDITERKRMENRLQAEKAEQQALIQKLGEAQEQLLQSEKMASIGQLAAGVAHEINNPVGYIYSNLNSLQGHTSKLIEMLDQYELIEPSASGDPASGDLIATKKKELDIDYLKEDVLDLVKESQEGIVRVKQIVQDLKDFSHVDQAEWQWADLHRGLDSTLNVAHNELKYKAEVVKEYGELPQVECLASQLNQVFMNLLVNAAHAMEQRGTITIRTGTKGEWVWVEIADTGKGIEAEHLKRIFDPFFTTKPVGTGTGLGLSLSYGIIYKHGGRIEVDSEPGKGTTFRVWLPVNQEQGTHDDVQPSNKKTNEEEKQVVDAENQTQKVENL